MDDFPELNSEDTTCEEDLVCVLESMVKETLSIAKSLIISDPAELFYYKIPLKYKNRRKPESYAENRSYYTTRSWGEYSGDRPPFDNISQHQNEVRQSDRLKGHEFFWSTIEEFNVKDIGANVREFVDTWQLTPMTKYHIGLTDQYKVVMGKGFVYYVVVIFSKPLVNCPNPLLTAKITFRINVPHLMPLHYPIMATYHFESFKTSYYALGRYQTNSSSFQRFYIDTILRTKLLLYPQILNCRFLVGVRSAEDEMTDEKSLDKKVVSQRSSDLFFGSDATNSQCEVKFYTRPGSHIRVFWETGNQN